MKFRNLLAMFIALSIGIPVLTGCDDTIKDEKKVEVKDDGTVKKSEEKVVRDGSILRDLNSLIPRNSGWEILSAHAINDKGQIAGEGLHNGKNRAFILTPIPGSQAPSNPGPTDIKLQPIKSIHHRRPSPIFRPPYA